MQHHLSPMHQRIITPIGAKKKFEPQWKLPQELIWIVEALETLLLLEIEKVAAKNGVDLDGLTEAVEDIGLDDMNAAGRSHQQDAS